jgi:hypothetical protein
VLGASYSTNIDISSNHFVRSSSVNTTSYNNEGNNGSISVSGNTYVSQSKP